jgi:ADP-heptose:LPS heptosyltransferase
MHWICWDYDVVTDWRTFKAGQRYVMENVNAGQFLGQLSWQCHTGDYTPPGGPPFPDDCAGKRLLVVRPGGLGDLLFITPALVKLRLLHPRLRISVAAKINYKCALENHPAIDQFLEYPLETETCDQFDFVVMLEDLIEFDPRGQQLHAVDLYASAFGLELAANEKRMSYFPTPDERATIRERFPRGTKQRYGVQLNSSAPVRHYPQIMNVVELLAQKGHEVVVFADPRYDKIAIQRHVIWSNQTDPPLSFRECAALAETCDCIVSPDSVFTHLSDAMNIPCVALYGSFPGKLRTLYSKRTITLTGGGACAPCFHHSRESVMPKHCPGKTEMKCKVLETIQPQRIVAKAEGLAHQFRARRNEIVALA